MSDKDHEKWPMPSGFSHHARFFLVLSLLLGWHLFATAARNEPQESPEPTHACTLKFSSGLVLSGIPLAKTLAQQAKGLTKRQNAGPGMLFSWDNQAPRVFWMRDTPIDLSIGFFDAQGLLFAIEDMAANSDSYHISDKPAKDALELAKGQFQKLGLKVGDRLVERRCRPLGATTPPEP
jgi:uncharacterized membrane protein (UPF0127 family)